MEFVREKVETWKTELQHLCGWACTQPHAAFAVYTHGWSSRWTFLTRTISNVGHLLTDLEAIIQLNLLPTLTGRPPLNSTERDMLSLPARHGGFGMVNSTTCDDNYEASRKITELPVEGVLPKSYMEIISAQGQIKRETQKQKNDQNIKSVQTSKLTFNPFNGKQWNLQQRMVPLPGSQHYPSESLASTYTSVPTEMH